MTEVLIFRQEAKTPPVLLHRIEGGAMWEEGRGWLTNRGKPTCPEAVAISTSEASSLIGVSASRIKGASYRLVNGDDPSSSYVIAVVSQA